MPPSALLHQGAEGATAAGGLLLARCKYSRRQRCRVGRVHEEGERGAIETGIRTTGVGPDLETDIKEIETLAEGSMIGEGMMIVGESLAAVVQGKGPETAAEAARGDDEN